MKLDYDDGRRVVRVVERDRRDVALPLRRRRPRRARRPGRPVAAMGVGRAPPPRRDRRPRRGRDALRVRHRAPGAVTGHRPRRLGHRADVWTSVGCRSRSSTPTASSRRCGGTGDGQLAASRRTPSARRRRSTTTATVCCGRSLRRGVRPRCFDHDGHGRLVRTERGDAAWEYGYSAAGRVCRGVEPGDVGWSATFGSHGAIEIVDRCGRVDGHVRLRRHRQRHRGDRPRRRGATATSTTRSGGLVASIEPTRGDDGEGLRPARPGGRVDRPAGERVAPARRRARTDRRVDRHRTVPRRRSPITRRASWRRPPAPDGRVWRCELDAAGRPVADGRPGRWPVRRSSTPRRGGCAAAPARRDVASSSSTTPPAASPAVVGVDGLAPLRRSRSARLGGVRPRARRRRRAPARAPVGRRRPPGRADR